MLNLRPYLRSTILELASDGKKKKKKERNLPAMQETSVQSLGWENPLEKGMATYFSILDSRIPWTEEPSRIQFVGPQRDGHD